MYDPKMKKKVTISTSGTAGPYIIIDHDLTKKVVDLLTTNQITYSIDEGAITTNTGNKDDVINLCRDVDVDFVQSLLDHEP
ncbi:MAG: hypothetical protein PF690_00380 [Deltaproteobacteria bacterium]|jgi:signal transduction histidine kinase|nr:hypothetical protein [Deltaproteobacteria bacterium]